MSGSQTTFPELLYLE